MRITIVTGPFYPVPPAPCGAVERLWQNLAEQFAAAGHEVTVLCRHWPGQVKNETVAGVRYVRRMHLSHTRSIHWDLVQDLFFSLRMWLIRPHADVMISNCFWLPVLARFGKRGGRVVVNVNRWPKGQMKLYRHAARLAAASTAILREVVRQCPACEPITKVFPNPIDIKAFTPPPVPRETPSGGGTILYTGRVHPEKGVHVLVEAFARLHADYPALKLRVIGPTTVEGGGGGEPYLAQLNKLAGGLPVEFLPPIYDRRLLADQLRAADYYVYPSLADQGESFGVAPLEAMATGLAPVVSALEVFNDFLEAEKTGLVFNHRAADPAGELATALRRLIDDPARSREMGLAAAGVAPRFSNEAVAGMYLADFQGLLPTIRANSLSPLRGRGQG